MGFVGRKVDDVMGRYGTVSIGVGTEGRGVEEGEYVSWVKGRE